MMNKLAISAATLAFSGLAAIPSFATTYIQAPDASLTQQFTTDLGKVGFNNGTTSTDLAGKAGSAYVLSNGIGVGWSGIEYQSTPNLYQFANSVSTAQTIWQPFIYTGDTLSSGSTYELGLHGNSQVDSTSSISTVYAEIFSYNSSATGAPIGAAVTSATPVTFNPSAGVNDDLYYSSDATLSNSLVNGQTYVLGISGNTTAGTAAANYVAIDTTNAAKYGLTLDANDSIFYQTDNNSSFSGASGATLNSTSTGPIAFRVYGATPAAAPEASSFVSMGVFLVLLGTFLVKRRLSTSAAD